MVKSESQEARELAEAARRIAQDNPLLRDLALLRAQEWADLATRLESQGR